jgi:hypothetical protein
VEEKCSKGLRTMMGGGSSGSVIRVDIFKDQLVIRVMKNEKK